MRNTANKQKCRKYEGELREKTGNLISWGKSASAQERLGPRKRWVRVWVWEEVEKMHLSPNSGPLCKSFWDNGDHLNVSNTELSEPHPRGVKGYLQDFVVN